MRLITASLHTGRTESVFFGQQAAALLTAEAIEFSIYQQGLPLAQLLQTARDLGKLGGL